jgi:hypothetical protein
VGTPAGAKHQPEEQGSGDPADEPPVERDGEDVQTRPAELLRGIFLYVPAGAKHQTEEQGPGDPADEPPVERDEEDVETRPAKLLTGIFPYVRESIEDLPEEVLNLVETALEPKTVAQYRRYFWEYQRWCRAAGKTAGTERSLVSWRSDARPSPRPTA